MWGYCLYLLSDVVSHRDFRWKDVTRYADGWAAEDNEVLVNNRIVKESYYVERHDQLRHTLDSANQRVKSGGAPGLPDDAEFDDFIHAQWKLFQVWRGPRRIVKIVPLRVPWSNNYPDSTEYGIQQWKLVFKRNFICAAEMKPGEAIPRGMFDSV
jgi:hypothetical protein